MLAKKTLRLCKKYNALLIINDHIDWVYNLEKLTQDNIGLHLGQADATLEEARATLRKNTHIGITCHNSIPMALQAQELGANYVAFGCY